MQREWEDGELQSYMKSLKFSISHWLMAPAELEVITIPEIWEQINGSYIRTVYHFGLFLLIMLNFVQGKTILILIVELIHNYLICTIYSVSTAKESRGGKDRHS